MRVERAWYPVILAGLASTALTLFLTFLLGTFAGFDPMGFYIKYIIPLGAIIVGLLAGSGYGLCAKKSNIKVTRGLLLGILSLHVASYFATHYVEYLVVLGALKKMAALLPLDEQARLRFPTFFTFFDHTARAVSFKPVSGPHAAVGPLSTGEPLGPLGYGVRFLEMTGFVAGSVIYPLILCSSAYCQRCQRYMGAGKQIVLAPDQATTEKLKSLAATNRLTEFADLVLELQERQDVIAAQPETRYAFLMFTCPECASGYLTVQRRDGTGDKTRSHDTGVRIEINPDFARRLKEIYDAD